MAQVLMAAVGALGLLVAVLGLVVWRLSAQVRVLVAQVEAMRPPVDLAGVRWSRQARPPEDRARPPEDRARPPGEVSVITHLSDDAEPTDLGTAGAASVVLAEPLIKLAAFTHGLRRALDDEHRLRMRLAFRRELRRQRRARRRELRSAAGSGS
jgi:hypothetical protein